MDKDNADTVVEISDDESEKQISEPPSGSEEESDIELNEATANEKLNQQSLTRIRKELDIPSTSKKVKDTHERLQRDTLNKRYSMQYQNLKKEKRGSLEVNQSESSPEVDTRATRKSTRAQKAVDNLGRGRTGNVYRTGGTN